MDRYKLQSRYVWLEELGVPEPYRQAMAVERKSLVFMVVALVFLLAMPVALMILGMRLVDATAQARAARLAAETGATLVHINVGLGPLLTFFGTLPLTICLLASIFGILPRDRFVNAISTGVNEPPMQSLAQWLTVILTRGSFQRAAASTNDFLAFLHAYNRDQIKRWGLAAIVLLIPGLAISLFETDNFWVAGPNGVTEHTFIPPFSSRSFALHEASGVTTGCNNVGNNNHLIYEIAFPSGDSYSLADAEPAKSGDVTPIEAIDALLPKGVMHSRWSHLNRDPLHPQCLAEWGRRYGNDGASRLAKLLRIKPNELDPR